MTWRKYLVLAAIVFCSTIGDFLLKIGMNEAGEISLTQPMGLIHALFNPWVASGILILIGFFVAFAGALSWADLSYVMPATALGYVLTAVLSAFALHEHVSVWRWAGVILISVAVGVVTRGPVKTVPGPSPAEGAR